MPVDGRHGDRVAQTQAVELVELRGRGADAVALVHAENHRLAASTQQSGDLFVGRRDAAGQVRHKNNRVRGVDGKLRLGADPRRDFLLGPGLYAAGVHQRKGPAVPLAAAVNPVARHARRIVHNGNAPAHQLVEQGGFPDVRPSHDGDDRFCQGASLLNFYVYSAAERPACQALFQRLQNPAQPDGRG